MASNVVVLHNNRRHVIKTTPSMLCRDILTQACEKIGYRHTEQYGLKYSPDPQDRSGLYLGTGRILWTWRYQ